MKVPRLIPLLLSPRLREVIGQSTARDTGRRGAQAQQEGASNVSSSSPFHLSRRFSSEGEAETMANDEAAPEDAARILLSRRSAAQRVLRHPSRRRAGRAKYDEGPTFGDGETPVGRDSAGRDLRTDAGRDGSNDDGHGRRRKRISLFEESAPLASSSSGVPSGQSLHGQILCGYQGWFAYPGDGAPINKWRHWFNAAQDPSLSRLTVDMYPSMDEYDEEDLGESNVLMGDGSRAKFYSAARPGVVGKHFEWMEQYGISGVFHMRFMEDLHLVNNRNWKTMVLRNVKNAAEATGRVFAVSYNIAGNTIDEDTVLDSLKEDWMRLVDEELVTQSGRYLHHNGLPVMRIFGIGFKDVKVADTAKMASLIDWLQNGPEEKYRVFLIGGVPNRWRDRINDSREEFAWKAVYESLDGIHPWHVGRWSTLDGFDGVYDGIISNDASYCSWRGILYMPTMWPGFSWHNLKKTRGQNIPMNSIPRLGGRFMWAQAHRYAADANINTIWMAQFDEVDEGTAIFKVASTQSEVPADGDWLTLDADGESLPSNWYLRLCGEAQRMLSSIVPLTDSIPITPLTESPTDYPTASPVTNAPTGSPSASPVTPNPTAAPTTIPTGTPTTSPVTKAPTSSPSASPVTSNPTASPTSIPTENPTTSPVTNAPTGSPSASPVTSNPTAAPTMGPTDAPTASPVTKAPTSSPSASPVTSNPTASPTSIPTENPTPSPATNAPTRSPSASPVTSNPSASPTMSPTDAPTTSPVTQAPTSSPSTSPVTSNPTAAPTMGPADTPTASPVTKAPTRSPSASPSTPNPTTSPTTMPTGSPLSTSPSSPTSSPISAGSPSRSPKTSPVTNAPTKSPVVGSATKGPTKSPSQSPTTKVPTDSPTEGPANSPTKSPTSSPIATSPAPSASPTGLPSGSPSKSPTSSPTKAPTGHPSRNPTGSPTKNPSKKPTEAPTEEPTSTPSKAPTMSPTKGQPTTPSPTPCDGMTVSVVVVTDTYPQETTWSITDTCSGVVAANSPSPGIYLAVGTEYTTNLCLPSAKYTFTINDSWGDGICCRYGNGSYTVYRNGDSVVAAGGQFARSETSAPFGSCLPTGPQIEATYDTSLQAPRCPEIGGSCSSGPLLNGRASIDRGVEPNDALNTLDGCQDGTSGEYHSDESIDRITVSAVGGGYIRAGGQIKVDAVVWAYSDGSGDAADFYHAADASDPSWSLITSVPAGGPGLRTLSAQYGLPASGGNTLQAVRVNFRWGGGGPSACSAGQYDDTDDLVFPVEPAGGLTEDVGGSTKAVEALTSSYDGAGPSDAPPPSPVTVNCPSVNDEYRCKTVFTACQWQGKKGCRALPHFFG